MVRQNLHFPDFSAGIPGDEFDEVDEFDDFQNFTDYAAVYYLRKHLKKKPGLNELVVCKLDDDIAMESGEIILDEQKRRDSDVSSICSSASKKRKNYEVAEVLNKLADNQANIEFD
jgi:hypothetical protein